MLENQIHTSIQYRSREDINDVVALRPEELMPSHGPRDPWSQVEAGPPESCCHRPSTVSVERPEQSLLSFRMSSTFDPVSSRSREGAKGM